MNFPITDRFKPADAAELYGVDAWGNGYLRVDRSGHLCVTPDGAAGAEIDVHEVVERLVAEGLTTPMLLRFPQLLGSQVGRLTTAFAQAIEEFDYRGRFNPVFPIKVNQQRPVVETLARLGADAGLGLEVGSRAELLAAMSLPAEPDSLLICNGFKDRGYLEAAGLAVRLGRRVVAVIEKPFELEPLIDLAASGAPLPWIGFRIRLQSRGSGMWEKSGGFASKFGLTTLQLIRAVERLEAAGLLDRAALLHFHIGSQITEIRKIKNAVLEAGRVYAKMIERGVPIRYLDVGGGLGIDYDGSKTSSDASMNYSVQEYANDVVFGLHEVCEQEGVSEPTIVCESGRMLTAYHSMLITDVRAVISGVDPTPPDVVGGEHQVVADLHEIAQTMTVKNYREYYHDAVDYRDQMYQLFNLGMLGLEDRAKAESLFWSIAERAVAHSKSAKFVADEFVELESRLHDKYICNFSVFQSLPDHWALDQLFPVMPIHRLDERPTRRAKLVDITCDSDGEVDKFIDPRELKEALDLHAVEPGQPYRLAFLLVGAYQDTMGDLHNLFGRVHEAEAICEPGGAVRVGRRREGDPASAPLAHFGYEPERMVADVAAALAERARTGAIDAADVERSVEAYRGFLEHYTYLNEPDQR